MALARGKPRGGGGWARLVDRWRLLGVGLWRLGWSAMAGLFLEKMASMGALRSVKAGIDNGNRWTGATGLIGVIGRAVGCLVKMGS
ncbi:hypothetical protein TIFTF001_042950 [Ficus carica]|uniref:Uncharacterized protein n=1 Tax=Ficus carica TaxID=3494 RepID=A0AA87YVV2_FICCA|nr:hypothetical protein TIFTF001_042950 [Ficus carica]